MAVEQAVGLVEGQVQVEEVLEARQDLPLLLLQRQVPPAM